MISGCMACMRSSASLCVTRNSFLVVLKRIIASSTGSGDPTRENERELSEVKGVFKGNIFLEKV